MAIRFRNSNSEKECSLRALLPLRAVSSQHTTQQALAETHIPSIDTAVGPSVTVGKVASVGEVLGVLPSPRRPSQRRVERSSALKICVAAWSLCTALPRQLGRAFLTLRAPFRRWCAFYQTSGYQWSAGRGRSIRQQPLPPPPLRGAATAAATACGSQLHKRRSGSSSVLTPCRAQ